MSDKELIAYAASHNNLAFESLIERYNDKIIRYIADRVSSYHDAVDISQDMWLKVHTDLQILANVEHFAAWLFVTARNMISDHTRQRRSHKRNNLKTLYINELNFELGNLLASEGDASIIASDLLSKYLSESLGSNLESPVAVSFCGRNFSPSDMELVLKYLSALYREAGGSGLKVVKGRQLQPALEEVKP